MREVRSFGQRSTLKSSLSPLAQPFTLPRFSLMPQPVALVNTLEDQPHSHIPPVSDSPNHPKNLSSISISNHDFTHPSSSSAASFPAKNHTHGFIYGHGQPSEPYRSQYPCAIQGQSGSDLKESHYNSFGIHAFEGPSQTHNWPKQSAGESKGKRIGVPVGPQGKSISVLERGRRVGGVNGYHPPMLASKP